jgi:hypothetical protein
MVGLPTFIEIEAPRNWATPSGSDFRSVCKLSRRPAILHLMKIVDNPASNLRGECNSDFGFLL